MSSDSESEHDPGVDQLKNDLYCCKCKHDLDKALYKICVHPACDCLPICVLCFEDLSQIEEQNDRGDDVSSEDEDVCIICKDSGQLIECSDCEQWYCVDCIQHVNHLSDDEVNDLVGEGDGEGAGDGEDKQNDEDWFCPCCDATRRAQLEAAVQFGKDQSVFKECLDIQASLPDAAAESVVELNAVSLLFDTLSNSIAFAHSMLEADKVAIKRSEIRDEMQQIQASLPVSERYSPDALEDAVDEELAELMRQWEHDLAILSAQMEECREVLDYKYECLSRSERYNITAEDMAADEHIQVRTPYKVVPGETGRKGFVDDGAVDDYLYQAEMVRLPGSRKSCGGSTPGTGAEVGTGVALVPRPLDQKLLVLKDRLFALNPLTKDSAVSALVDKYQDQAKYSTFAAPTCALGDRSEYGGIWTKLLPAELQECLPVPLVRALVYCRCPSAASSNASDLSEKGELGALTEHFSLPAFIPAVLRFTENFSYVVESKLPRDQLSYSFAFRHVDPADEDAAPAPGSSMVGPHRVQLLHSLVLFALRNTLVFADRKAIQQQYSDVIPADVLDGEELEGVFDCEDGDDNGDVETQSQSQSQGARTSSYKMMQAYRKYRVDAGPLAFSEFGDTSVYSNLNSRVEQLATGVGPGREGGGSNSGGVKAILLRNESSDSRKCTTIVKPRPRDVQATSGVRKPRQSKVGQQNPPRPKPKSTPTPTPSTKSKPIASDNVNILPKTEQPPMGIVPSESSNSFMDVDDGLEVIPSPITNLLVGNADGDGGDAYEHVTLAGPSDDPELNSIVETHFGTPGGNVAAESKSEPQSSINPECGSKPAKVVPSLSVTLPNVTLTTEPARPTSRLDAFFKGDTPPVAIPSGTGAGAGASAVGGINSAHPTGSSAFVSPVSLMKSDGGGGASEDKKSTAKSKIHRPKMRVDVREAMEAAVDLCSSDNSDSDSDTASDSESDSDSDSDTGNGSAYGSDSGKTLGKRSRVKTCAKSTANKGVNKSGRTQGNRATKAPASGVRAKKRPRLVKKSEAVASSATGNDDDGDKDSSESLGVDSSSSEQDMDIDSAEEEAMFDPGDDDDIKIISYTRADPETSAETRFLEGLAAGVDQETGQKSSKPTKLPIGGRRGNATSITKVLEITRKNAYKTFKQYDGAFASESGGLVNDSRPEADPEVFMPSRLAHVLKPHQIEAVRFLWRNCVVSVEALRASASGQLSHHIGGSGCLLAHCMGLGKTLTIISFLVVLFASPVISAMKTQEEEISNILLAPNGQNKDRGKRKGGKNAAVVSAEATVTKNTVTEQDEDSLSDQPESIGTPASPIATEFRERRLLHRALIITPVNVLQNWEIEFRKWTGNEFQSCVQFYTLGTSLPSAWAKKYRQTSKNASEATMTREYRLSVLQDWYGTGGVLVIGYPMLSNLVYDDKEKEKEKEREREKDRERLNSFPGRPSPPQQAASSQGGAESTSGSDTGGGLSFNELCRKYLLSPGPDVVVFDEAHVIKNKNSRISQSVGRMKTKMRIALTGSPLQNNLIEYFCMINWVKPGHLGRLKTFQDRFEKPMREGEVKNASKGAIRRMRHRSHLLHKRLRGIVLRKDVDTLAADLPPKREFVLVFKMTPLQKHMYKRFLIMVYNDKNVGSNADGRNSSNSNGMLQNLVRRAGPTGASRNILFACYQGLQRVWNHPLCTIAFSHNARNKEERDREKAGQGIAGASIAAGTASLVSSGSSSSLSLGQATSTSTSTNKLGRYCPDMSVMYASMARDSAKGVGSGVDAEFQSLQQQIFTKRQLTEDDDNAELEGELSELAGDADYLPPQRQRGDGGATPLDHERLGVSPTADLFDDWSDGKEADTGASGVAHDWYLVGDAAASGAVESVTPREPCSMVDMMQCSNKILGLLYILMESIRIGDKVVVFSLSLNMLDVIELILRSNDWHKLLPDGDGDEKGSDSSSSKAASSSFFSSEGGTGSFSRWSPGVDYIRIDGSVEGSRRQELIKRFNDRPASKLCILSTQACNMGINLHTANRVIIFDTSWNPAHDLQAMFRCYRYGQKKSVFIYRFLTADSMEEKIYKRQVMKKALASRVVDGQAPENQFNAEDRENLLIYRDTESTRNLFRTTKMKDNANTSALSRELNKGPDASAATALSQDETRVSQGEAPLQIGGIFSCETAVPTPSDRVPFSSETLSLNPTQSSDQASSTGHSLSYTDSQLTQLSQLPIEDEAEGTVEVSAMLDAHPKDKVLRKLVQESSLGASIILEIEDESILLQDVEEEHLDEAEQMEAEQELDREENPHLTQPVPMVGAGAGVIGPGMVAAPGAQMQMPIPLHNPVHGQGAGIGDFPYPVPLPGQPMPHMLMNEYQPNMAPSLPPSYGAGGGDNVPGDASQGRQIQMSHQSFISGTGIVAATAQENQQEPEGGGVFADFAYRAPWPAGQHMQHMQNSFHGPGFQQAQQQLAQYQQQQQQQQQQYQPQPQQYQQQSHYNPPYQQYQQQPVAAAYDQHMANLSAFKDRLISGQVGQEPYGYEQGQQPHAHIVQPSGAPGQSLRASAPVPPPASATVVPPTRTVEVIDLLDSDEEGGRAPALTTASAHTQPKNSATPVTTVEGTRVPQTAPIDMSAPTGTAVTAPAAPEPTPVTTVEGTQVLGLVFRRRATPTLPSKSSSSSLPDLAAGTDQTPIPPPQDSAVSATPASQPSPGSRSLIRSQSPSPSQLQSPSKIKLPIRRPKDTDV